MCIANDQVGIGWNGRGYISDSFSPRQPMGRPPPRSPLHHAYIPLPPSQNTNTPRPSADEYRKTISNGTTFGPQDFQTLPYPFFSLLSVRLPSLNVSIGPRRSKIRRQRDVHRSSKLSLSQRMEQTHLGRYPVTGQPPLRNEERNVHSSPFLRRTYRWDAVQNV